MYGWMLDDVVIVQYQDGIPAEVIQFDEQSLEDIRGWKGSIRCGGMYSASLKGVEGRYQVAGEADRIVIPAIQRKPGDRSRLPGRPFRQQGCLAKSGRRGNQGQRTLYTILQLAKQTRAVYQRLPYLRNEELGSNRLRGWI